VVRRLIPILALVVGCGGPSVVSVLSAHASATEDQLTPVRVAVDATSTHLPLVVSGSDIAFGDIDRALARAIEHALEPTTQALARRNAKSLGLTVELVEAHAEYARDRLVVRLAARATLREDAGNVYVAQTHAHASASAVLPAENGAEVVLSCTDSLAHQLSNWLRGMDLR
jgi:hypothetical protein